MKEHNLKKGRLLMLLLSIAMVLTMMPGFVMSCMQEANAEGYVAYLNNGSTNQGYSSIEAAISAFNASTVDAEHTLTISGGSYSLPVNTVLIEENPSYPQRHLTITAAENAEVTITPDYTGEKFQTDSNNAIFCISGLSSYNGAGVEIKNINFNLTVQKMSGDSSGCRIFAVYALSGGSGKPDGLFADNHRYAHDIVVDNCTFDGPSGKFASAFGANQSNSQPKNITIKNCTGENLNCWYNGYGTGFVINNCDATGFLCIGNYQSTDATVTLDDVDGTYFAAVTKAGATDSTGNGTEKGVVYTKGGSVSITGCDVELLGKGSGGAANGFVYVNSGTQSVSVKNSSIDRSINQAGIYDVYSKVNTCTVTGENVNGNNVTYPTGEGYAMSANSGYNFPVAQIDNGESIAYYGTLAEAINAVNEGETIKLLINLTDTSAVTTTANAFVLDLNGFSYKNTASGDDKFTNNTQITVIGGTDISFSNYYAKDNTCGLIFGNKDNAVSNLKYDVTNHQRGTICVHNGTTTISGDHTSIATGDNACFYVIGSSWGGNWKFNHYEEGTHAEATVTAGTKLVNRGLHVGDEDVDAEGEGGYIVTDNTHVLNLNGEISEGTVWERINGTINIGKTGSIKNATYMYASGTTNVDGGSIILDATEAGGQKGLNVYGKKLGASVMTVKNGGSVTFNGSNGDLKVGYTTAARDGKLVITGEDSSFTAADKAMTVQLSGTLEVKDQGKLSVKGLTNAGNIAMNYAGTISVSDSCSNMGEIKVDMTDATMSSYKLIDYTGSGTPDYGAYEFATGKDYGYTLTVKDNDLYACKNVAAITDEQSGETIEYATLAEAIEAVTGTEQTTIKMIANTTEDVTIGSTQNIVLDLNGCVISKNGTAQKAIIANNGILTVRDSNSTVTHKFTGNAEDATEETKKYEDAGLWTWDEKNGTNVINGGIITGNNTSYNQGGAIYNSKTGTLTFEAGTLVGNTARGAGIYNDGILYMTGGTITHNEGATDHGAGLHNQGTATVSGGVISYNHMTSAFDAGISNYSKGDLTISGTAKVCYNNAAGGSSKGGGVGNDSGCTLTIDGGEIFGNYANTYGGGLMIYGGTVTMKKGSIHHNYAYNMGGGVYVTGAFELSGGTISNNTAGRSNSKSGRGSGVCVNDSSTASLVMTAGSITNNTSLYKYRAGLEVCSGTADISGGTISGNTSPGSGGVPASGFEFAIWSFTTGKVKISGDTVVSGKLDVYYDFTIENGTFTGPIAINEDGDATNAVKINGGKFGTETLGAITATSSIAEPTIQNTICGGVFTDATKEATSESIIADGKIFVTNTDKTTYDQGYHWMLGDAVAQITVGETTTKYGSLEEAFAAANAGDTVKMLADVELSQGIDLAKNVTLDLNGKAISAVATGWTSNSTAGEAGKCQYLFGVKRGGKLTINDSSEDKTGAINASTNTAGSVYTAVAMTIYGEDATGTAAELVVNGGNITGYYYAITGNGSRHNTAITINDGTITATADKDNLGIYNPQEGTVTIKGGTITGYNAAVEMRAGTLNVKGGTLKSTSNTFKTEKNGSGTTIKGAAIALSQHTTNKGVVANISSGLTEGHHALYACSLEDGTTGTQVEVNITGGEFKATGGTALSVQDGASMEISGYPVVNSQETCVGAFGKSTVTIEGGTFTSADNSVVATNGSADKGGNTITIKGGTFNGNISTAEYIACGVYVANSDTVSIEGGTFNITNGVGVLVRAGTTTITGGKFKTSGTGTGYVGDKSTSIPAGQPIYFDKSNPAYPGYTENDSVVATGGVYKQVIDLANYLETTDELVKNTDDQTADEYPWMIGKKKTQTLSIVTTNSKMLKSDGTESTVTRIATLTGGGQYENGTSVTLTASPVDNFVFKGWYLENANGTPVSTDMEYEFTVSGDANYIAKYQANAAKATVEVNKTGAAAPDGTVTVTSTSGTGTETKQTVDVGNEVTMTASVPEAKEDSVFFICWQNTSGAVISTERNYTCTALQSQTAEAVFLNEGAAVVYFKNDEGDLLQSKVVAASEAKEVNTVVAPSKKGQQFTSWVDKDGKELDDAAVMDAIQDAAAAVGKVGKVDVTASYTELAEYTVIIKQIKDDKDNTALGNDVNLTKPVGTAMSFTAQEKESGLEFKGYRKNIGGQYITTSKTLVVNPDNAGTFTYYAVYGEPAETPVERPATVSVSTPFDASTNVHKIGLTMSWNLPEGSTLTEAGFYYGLDKDELDAMTYGFKTTLTGIEGSYTININVNGAETTTLYVRAYVKYTDANGVAHFVINGTADTIGGVDTKESEIESAACFTTSYSEINN